MTLPEKFIERVLRELGEEDGRALCEALETPSPVSVRLNPDKCPTAGVTSQDGLPATCVDAAFAGSCDFEPGTGRSGDGNAREDSAALPVCDSREALLRRLGASRRVPWCDQGWYLAARPSFTLDSDFHAGAYYVQEPASQMVGYLLRDVAVAGARILDLCAAPGGKTTLYASLAGPEGLVVANEIDRRRAQTLADNVRKWGTGNVVVTTCEPARLGDFEGWFDVVAVDAPCSGEGMFRKDPASRGEWSVGNVRVCAARQDTILREAWRALKPGGTLLYSTCTFNRDEDEGALERMAVWAGEEIVESDETPVDAKWGVLCGRVGAWRTCRFYPHLVSSEGFFAAVVRKAPDAGGRMRTPKARRTMLGAVDRATAAELACWVLRPGAMRFAEVASTCYGWYAAQADAVGTLSGALPVIYSGVAMGQLFKGRLKPDPALAFFAGLNRDAVPVAELDESEALNYLRRQEISVGALAEGLNLVCARGRALGFAKRIGGRVNNMYPDSLRIRMK